jgi:hypothetical protein
MNSAQTVCAGALLEVGSITIKPWQCRAVPNAGKQCRTLFYAYFSPHLFKNRLCYMTSILLLEGTLARPGIGFANRNKL